ncbi:cytochrome b [Pyruvatibacter sp.]|uniref:cytochrome b n=1 Tax=Pyruvatibacter sp. TaxID=1981328 RepID=UPI0032F03511
MVRPLTNSQERYGVVAITLHWLIAFAVIGLYGVGTFMVDMKPSLQQFELYQLHKSFGITVLVLTVLRLIWRIANPRPALPPGMPRWQVLAAKATHWGFYTLLLAAPLAGWAMVSASSFNVPTVVFGLFTVPHMEFIATSPDKQALEGTFEDLHALFADGMLLLFLAHVGAALYHHIKLHDTVLLKMLPVSQRAYQERKAHEQSAQR